MLFILLTIIIILLSIFYLQRKKSSKILQQLNINGPTPNAIFGNIFQIHSQTFSKFIVENSKKYGKIWGYFEGPTPIIVTSDSLFAQEVLIKQFNNFNGRKLFPVQENPDNNSEVNMFVARGFTWKMLRSTLNPAFSEFQMRRLFPMIDNCVQNMLSAIESNQEVDIYKHFQLLTLETICECAFGVSLKSQQDTENNIVTQLRIFFDQDLSATASSRYLLGTLLPELRFQIFKITKPFINNRGPLATLGNMLENVINARKFSRSTKILDLLQLLLDAEQPIDNDSVLEDSDLVEPAVFEVKKSSRVAKNLTANQIKAQAMLFLFAGYETSSTALAYIVYDLIRNPHVLQRIKDELQSRDLLDSQANLGDVDFYKKICDIPYLEALIWESLRCHTFVSPFVNRLCMNTTQVSTCQGQLTVPRGCAVHVDMESMHFDRDLWAATNIDVNIYEPERHLVAAEDGSGELRFKKPDLLNGMVIFGAGPRNCIGQRFALMEIRTCLVRLLMRFSLERGKKFSDELEIRMGATLVPKNGIHVICRPHESSS